MRKNFGSKPWMYPQPVLMIATYDENGTVDVMNAAWGGISEENQISICLSADHKTTKNILCKKGFTVSMAVAKYTAECDYFGISSGNQDPDKFQRSGLHAVKSEFVDAPILEELPMALECRLINYSEETCILNGEILNVSADESILNEAGKIDATKLDPITFDACANVYRRLGDVVGKSFSEGKRFLK